VIGSSGRLRSVPAVIVECAVYEDGNRRPGALELSDACEAGQEPGAFVWIDLFEPTPDEFGAIRAEFGLHPLAIEDALEAHERPKLERFDDVAFLVLKTAHYDDPTEDITFGEVMIFAGGGFVITVRHGTTTDLGPLRERLENQPDRLRHGPLGVVHAVVDQVVDDYEPVVEGLQEDIDQVEEGLFAAGGNGATRRIYALGREVIEFSRAVQPLVEPVRRLAEGAIPGADDELVRYFRDVHDHVARVDSWVSSQRELLSNLLQANLTQVSIVQNEDMRKISAWVAIVAVPTAIAGIYGMNFRHMPELKWELGYPSVLLAIALICTYLYTRFKKAGWL
jgi:magnesium transporter